jgi:hypothetical protein
MSYNISPSVWLCKQILNSVKDLPMIPKVGQNYTIVKCFFNRMQNGPPGLVSSVRTMPRPWRNSALLHFIGSATFQAYRHLYCQNCLGTMYQNRESYTKWPQNSLNCPKIGQIAVQYSKWPRNIPTKSSSRPSRKYPYLDFWYENILSGNPAMIFYCPLFLQKEAKYITYQSKIETLLATMSTAGNVSFSPRFLTFQTLQS